jgi:MFS transporter, DHA2 family, methylenomycin A resistance protein
VTFSALLLFAGTLSDRTGARRAYRIGMVIFVVASAACGLAPSLGVLLAARVAQGIGAALITPTSLALIREAYEDTRQRAKAVAYWALGGSVAAAAGPILGGILTELDWRIIFFINLPVGAVALILLGRLAKSPRLQQAGGHPGVYLGRPGRRRFPRISGAREASHGAT